MVLDENLIMEKIDHGYTTDQIANIKRFSFDHISCNNALY